MIAEITALIAGGIIGAGFGMVQDAARRHNEKRQAEGKINNIWSLMPGSGTRVAYLLIALVIIQLICPLLFKDGVQWWVSGGLVGGYGFMLYRQLRQKMSAR
ncbi:MAG: hypothetical protein QOD03_1680 [Verrucomicrobiota bacterium]